MISTVGESILMFNSPDKKKVYDLISGPVKRCDSSFECDDSKAIRVLVLSLIGLDLTHYGSQILLFFKQTFFYMQQKEKLYKEQKDKEKADDLVPKEFELISGALNYLVKNKLVTLKSSEFVTINENEPIEPESDQKNLYFGLLEITKLGMAAIKGNIDLDYVHQLYDDLDVGLRSIVLSSCIHLLYLCTPYELVESLMNLDFDTYARKVSVFLVKDCKKNFLSFNFVYSIVI